MCKTKAVESGTFLTQQVFKYCGLIVYVDLSHLIEAIVSQNIVDSCFRQRKHVWVGIEHLINKFLDLGLVVSVTLGIINSPTKHQIKKLILHVVTSISLKLIYASFWEPKILVF